MKGITLSDKTISGLIKMLSKILTLIDLNLSWSNVAPQVLDQILVSLNKQKRIRYLNISWLTMPKL